MKLRGFHRLFGLTLFVFVINSAVTGLLRANARWWYWNDRLAKESAARLASPAISIEQVFARFPDTAIARIELKLLAGKPAYLIEGQRQGKKLSVLVDAVSGQVISPVSRERAIEIAEVFVPEQTAVAAAEDLPSYLPRKGNGPRPAIRVLFEDARKTEVFVDQDSGAVLTILDRGRRFGMWVVRLHELDFAGASRAVLTLLGLGVSFLAVTGVSLALGGRRRKPAMDATMPR